MEVIFIFDFDGTLTTKETLPHIAENYPKIKDKILNLTTETVNGKLPFEVGFKARFELLKNIKSKEISEILDKINVHKKIQNFINENPSKSCIATGNLDAWICQALDKFKCLKYTSRAETNSFGEVIDIKTIIKKNEVVKKFQNEGKFVVFIGDGNNDAMAMEEADISIAAGLVHHPANSVLDVADYAVFSEDALLELLIQINAYFSKVNINKKYSVLLCAGTGSRLGLNITKALLVLNGTTLIKYHLKRMSKDFDLVFVVVGFQSSSVITNSKPFWKNIVYVLNREYTTRGPGHSLFLAAKFINEKILVIDCDLIISEESYNICIEKNVEYVGCSSMKSSNPIIVSIEGGKVIEFKKLNLDDIIPNENSLLEWTGPLKINASKIIDTSGNIFELLETLPPLNMLEVDAFDIDTVSDYNFALKVIKDY